MRVLARKRAWGWGVGACVCVCYCVCARVYVDISVCACVETSVRRDGAHMGFSERIDTALNWTGLLSVTWNFRQGRCLRTDSGRWLCTLPSCCERRSCSAFIRGFAETCLSGWHVCQLRGLVSVPLRVVNRTILHLPLFRTAQPGLCSRFGLTSRRWNSDWITVPHIENPCLTPTLCAPAAASTGRQTTRYYLHALWPAHAVPARLIRIIDAMSADLFCAAASLSCP